MQSQSTRTVALPPSTAPQTRSAVEPAAGKLTRFRWALLELREQFIRDEGHGKRGRKFIALAMTLQHRPKGDPPLTQQETLELLGIPDYSRSGAAGSEVLYLAEDGMIAVIFDTDGRFSMVGWTGAPAGPNLPPRGVSALIHLPETRPAPLPPGSGYLGVGLGKRRRLSSKWWEEEDVPGIWVRGIVPDSPASRSDLRRCDVIYKLNGVSVESDDAATFIPRIASMKPGDTIALSVRPCADDSPNNEHVVKITLGARPGPTTRE